MDGFRSQGGKGSVNNTGRGNAPSEPDYDTLFSFIASDAEEAEKIRAVLRHWDLLATRKDVECIFLHLDFLNALMQEAEIREDITGFVCYSVAISSDVRDYILEEFLSDDGIWDITVDNYVSCVVTVLSACCEESLTSGQMGRVIDYAFLLPNELDKLRLLKPACRSLSILPIKHAIRIARLLNNIVSSFVALEERVDTAIGMLACSVAKKARARISGERSCFDRLLWKDFLARCGLECEIPKICNAPVIVHDTEELPYKVKEHMYDGKARKGANAKSP